MLLGEFIKITKDEFQVTGIICDICKKTYINSLDIQEFINIKFQGGYSSIFGDGAIMEGDFCQDCIKKLLGDFLREVDK